jgi:hypothetical protein
MNRQSVKARMSQTTNIWQKNLFFFFPYKPKLKKKKKKEKEKEKKTSTKGPNQEPPKIKNKNLKTERECGQTTLRACLGAHLRSLKVYLTVKKSVLKKRNTCLVKKLKAFLKV